MSIRVKLSILSILAMLILLLNLFALKFAENKELQLAEEAQLRYLSFQLADEFRQTSQDLTRLGRSYVVTGEDRYKDAYWEIVDWRSGKTPRPETVHHELKPGEPIAQTELMKSLGFTRTELDLLARAGQFSNDLIATETQAMDSIEQNLIAQGPFLAGDGESVRSFASRILFDDNYHREVDRIMAPVTEFFGELDRRTTETLESSKAEAHLWRNISSAFSFSIWAIVAVILYFTMQHVLNPLKKAAQAMSDISEGEGDLTQRLSHRGKSEISDLAQAFNVFANHIQGLVQELHSTFGDISDSSQQLSNTAQDTDQAVHHQQQMLGKLHTDIDHLVPTVQAIASDAQSAATDAQESNEEAKQAINVVNTSIDDIQLLSQNIRAAADAVSELATNTNEIGSVIDVIRGIADQTNLLALNAAIESARAGEQGKGFAVVADEVRQLAQRTQDSTQEIQSMIEKLQHGAQKAAGSMTQSAEQAIASAENANSAGLSLERITAAISEISGKNQAIAKASEEQNNTILSVQDSVDHIQQQLANTSAGSERTTQSSHKTQALTEQASRLISRFKV
ncbi:methyl-accepting chemotaxis protein [Pseudoteredinibacter isoporae]|uniref:methyl-accepting chemotaxis protein n=1 Tax=Pseudoteredinibacter isoporae TaxID=570281 RepID=UPI003108E3B5